MKQVIQNFKSGKLSVEIVPRPKLSTGYVLVENRCSLISPGTEKSTVNVAKANLLGKAKQRPDLVAQVIQNIKKEGIKATLDKVNTKLDSLKALGYSTSGIVLESKDLAMGFKPGDRVACAGADYASHAELVSVPQNLVVKIPENVTFEEASFTTLGAIALQGVRIADPTIGEKVCVIGLGILGQLTVQLLLANGCSVAAVDFNQELLQLAQEAGADMTLKRDDSNLISNFESFTNGYGFDKVIITAATSTNDPIILATEISRKKGKIIIVGAVKMDIPREPYFYKKELELLISCSYGPGRYDPQYEENHQDYPFPYVRWTEKRNMEAFLNLISQKKINVLPLISHEFEIDEADKAYEMITKKQVDQPSFVGVLLRYKENGEKLESKVELAKAPLSKLNIGFLGAGSFAQSYLIPHVKNWGAPLLGVLTSKGITAKNVAEKFKFGYCTTNPSDIFSNDDINTVFIASPHSSHSKFVIDSIKNNKNVFVEKPLAINIKELKEVIEHNKTHNGSIMVGFNRRFSPAAVVLKKEFSNSIEPFVINIRVNAGFLPKDHWTQDPHIGGGRIVGEICHFIDFMQYITGSDPIQVYADSFNSKNATQTNEDQIAIILKFKNGSLGNLTYLANGDKGLPKELIEIYNGGKTGVINDFKEAFIYKNNKKHKITSRGKGHKEEVYTFLDNLRNGGQSPISFRSICITTLTTFKILESLSSGMPEEINPEELDIS